MNLLKKCEPTPGYIPVIDDPKLCSLIKFGLLNLSDGEIYGDETADEEACLVLLGGRCTVSVGDEKWQSIGGRTSVFGGKPHSVYIPREHPFQVEAVGDCNVAVCRAPAKTQKNPKLITPEEVKCRTVGKWNWKRQVCDIMGNDSSIPETLIIGETYNPPGNWSSAPPHKHDVSDLPRESKLEEIYFYKFNPPQGFGLQRVYTKDGDFDEAYVVNDGDTVAIPKGYHPVVAAPGYSLYYLWILAGEKRVMKPNDDPAHAWLKNCEPIMSEII